MQVLARCLLHQSEHRQSSQGVAWAETFRRVQAQFPWPSLEVAELRLKLPLGAALPAVSAPPWLRLTAMCAGILYLPFCVRPDATPQLQSMWPPETVVKSPSNLFFSGAPLGKYWDPCLTTAAAVQRYVHTLTHADVEPSLANVYQYLRQRVASTDAAAESPAVALLLASAAAHAPPTPEVSSTPATQEALDLHTRVHGTRHPDAWPALRQRAAELERSRQFCDAEELLRAELTARAAASGLRHPAVAALFQKLAAVLIKQGKLDEGGDLLKHALALFSGCQMIRRQSVAAMRSLFSVILTEQGLLEQVWTRTPIHLHRSFACSPSRGQLSTRKAALRTTKL